MSTFYPHLSVELLRQPLNNETPHLQSFSESLGKLYHTLSQRLAERNYRQSLRGLLHHSDRVLDDIGMTRGELRAALELPLSQSARQAMSQWRAERRITG